MDNGQDRLPIHRPEVSQDAELVENQHRLRAGTVDFPPLTCIPGTTTIETFVDAADDAMDISDDAATDNLPEMEIFADFDMSTAHYAPFQSSTPTLAHCGFLPPGRGGGRRGPNRGGPNRRGPNGDGPNGDGPNGGRGGGDEGDFVDPSLNLRSVGGLPEHINFLQRAVIYPLKNKDAFNDWGIDLPKGILFHGPPGTGKTLLAKCLANAVNAVLGGTTKVTFFYQKGSESNSMWFGESEENLRKLFNKAKANVPSIIFFDELDALCPNRDKASESSEAYVGVVTELLALIDSVKRGDVLIIGATNRLDAIDVAIRRPGRFDKDLAFNLPDIPGRKKIVQIHTQKWFRDQPDSEQLETIANNTIGYSGADLQKLCTDTFIAAKDRCGRVPAAEITISSADWAKAMKEMRPSKSDVFESTLIAAKPPLPLMMPLAGNMIKEIVTSLGDILPRDNGHFPFAMTGMRSYLVREGNLDSEVFLNHVILTGVLSDPTVSNVPVYYLDLPHLAGRIDDGLTAIKAARCIIKQAENSDRPCILFVPGINWINDAIAQHTREQNDFVFFDLLRTLAGTNAILLASVIGNMKEISAEILTPFSDRNVYKVRVPEREERLAFYRQIFDDLIPTEDDEPREKRAREESRDDVDRFEKHLQTAVDLTENDPCDFLLKLYEKLRKVKIEHYVLDENQGNLRYDLDGLDRSFTEIFDLYHLNRLQE